MTPSPHTDGIAAFRRSPQHDDLARLAAEHLQADLTADDRRSLKLASTRVSTHAVVGSLFGLGLGIWAAVRLRRSRAGLFGALRAAEKPVRVVFQDGRQEPIPDLTPMLKPTRVGDYATVFFFGLGGLFLGGETGFLTGTWSATRMVTQDPDRLRRIEDAYRKFRIDCLKTDIARLESGHSLFR